MLWIRLLQVSPLHKPPSQFVVPSHVVMLLPMQFVCSLWKLTLSYLYLTDPALHRSTFIIGACAEGAAMLLAAVLHLRTRNLYGGSKEGPSSRQGEEPEHLRTHPTAVE